MSIYDEGHIEFAAAMRSNEYGMVERSRRLHSIAHPVAYYVPGGTTGYIYFYAERATLDSDLQRPGGANWENADATVSFDEDGILTLE